MELTIKTAGKTVAFIHDGMVLINESCCDRNLKLAGVSIQRCAPDFKVSARNYRYQSFGGKQKIKAMQARLERAAIKYSMLTK